MEWGGRGGPRSRVLAIRGDMKIKREGVPGNGEGRKEAADADGFASDEVETYCLVHGGVSIGNWLVLKSLIMASTCSFFRSGMVHVTFEDDVACPCRLSCVYRMAGATGFRL